MPTLEYYLQLSYPYLKRIIVKGKYKKRESRLRKFKTYGDMKQWLIDNTTVPESHISRVHEWLEDAVAGDSFIGQGFWIFKGYPATMATKRTEDWTAIYDRKGYDF